MRSIEVKPVIKTTNAMKHTSDRCIQSNQSDLKILQLNAALFLLHFLMHVFCNEKLTLLPWHAVSGFCLFMIGAGGIVVVDVVVALVVVFLFVVVVGFLVVVARVVDRVVD